MALHTIHVTSEGWKEMDAQRLLLRCFFLLAAISKCSDLFIVTLLIYLVSSGMMLFSLFSSFQGDESFFFFSSNFYFLLNLGNIFFTESKPLHPILFQCMLVQWEMYFFWPVKCSNSFLEDRSQDRNQFLGSLFLRQFILSFPNPHFVFKFSIIKWN